MPQSDFDWRSHDFSIDLDFSNIVPHKKCNISKISQQNSSIFPEGDNFMVANNASQGISMYLRTYKKSRLNCAAQGLYF